MSQDSDPFDEDYVAEEEEVDPEDEGYTTGFSSGDDDGDNENYFGQDMDLDSLLANMAQPQAGDDPQQLQPYQILRQQRNQQQQQEQAGGSKGGRKSAKGSRRRRGGASDSDEDWAADEPLELTSTSEPKRKMNKKKQRGGGGTRRGPRQMELPEHISRMVGHANLLYASNKYQAAVDLLLEVIRQVPNLADPYHTLGALHEVLGQPRLALNFYMIAAHMSGKDVGLWHKLAEMSLDNGFIRQAIYCYNKVLAKDGDHFEARFARARLYPLINEPWKAKQQYSALLERHPGHPEVVKALVTLYHDFGQSGRAIEMLEEQLAKHYASVDLTHINMLADLYMAMGHYNNAAQLVNRSEVVMCREEPLPIDLKVRRGACYAHMGDAASAQADLYELLALPVVDDQMESYQDLYVLAVTELSRLGLHEMALPFMDRLRDAPGVLELPEQWSMLADCYVKAGRRHDAVAMYAARLQGMGLQDPRYMEASLALAALHVGGGDSAAAEAVLAALDGAVAAHQLTLPEGQLQQLELFLAKASLQLQLGHTQAFADSLTPHISHLLQQMEDNAAILAAATKASASGAVPKELVKALKRRKMYARKGGRKGEGGGEVDSVFKGYISRDRRKPHIVEADRAAEQLLRQARAAGAASGAEETEAEPDDDAAAAAAGAEGDLPAELSALVAAASSDQEELPDLFRNEQLYGCFVDLIHALLDLGREAEAAALLARAQAVAAYSLSSRDPSWIGPSALDHPGKRRKAKGAAGGGDGNLSDWGQGAAAAAGGPAAAAERREEARLLREGLKLMAAEVAFRQGDVEETLKLLKTVLQRWPYSWRAWSLYCSCAGHRGGVSHWMKMVASLRAKHPDSLPLQVLAAHADNMQGEAGTAIQSYAAALMQLPNEPLLLLCLGVAQIDAALTARHCKDRNTALLRGFAALHTYAKYRGPAAEAEAEAAYNLGRAAHESSRQLILGINSDSVPFTLHYAAPAAGMTLVADQLQAEQLQHRLSDIHQDRFQSPARIVKMCATARNGVMNARSRTQLPDERALTGLPDTTAAAEEQQLDIPRGACGGAELRASVGRYRRFSTSMSGLAGEASSLSDGALGAAGSVLDSARFGGGECARFRWAGCSLDGRVLGCGGMPSSPSGAACGGGGAAAYAAAMAAVSTGSAGMAGQ
ncbi:hypothetical protein OEZ86_003745 [Tetradesmus obliquus]|nr:hypothetical protein OEZ86_003745 [Tetradesmus obliquus]